jgi:hypothetical protein
MLSVTSQGPGDSSEKLFDDVDVFQAFDFLVTVIEDDQDNATAPEDHDPDVGEAFQGAIDTVYDVPWSIESVDFYTTVTTQSGEEWKYGITYA